MKAIFRSVTNLLRYNELIYSIVTDIQIFLYKRIYLYISNTHICIALYISRNKKLSCLFLPKSVTLVTHYKSAGYKSHVKICYNVSNQAIARIESSNLFITI